MDAELMNKSFERDVSNDNLFEEVLVDDEFDQLVNVAKIYLGPIALNYTLERLEKYLKKRHDICTIQYFQSQQRDNSIYNARLAMENYGAMSDISTNRERLGNVSALSVIAGCQPPTDPHMFSPVQEQPVNEPANEITNQEEPHILSEVQPSSFSEPSHIDKSTSKKAPVKRTGSNRRRVLRSPSYDSDLDGPSQPPPKKRVSKRTSPKVPSQGTSKKNVSTKSANNKKKPVNARKSPSKSKPTGKKVSKNDDILSALDKENIPSISNTSSRFLDALDKYETWYESTNYLNSSFEEESPPKPKSVPKTKNNVKKASVQKKPNTKKPPAKKETPRKKALQKDKSKKPKNTNSKKPNAQDDINVEQGLRDKVSQAQKSQKPKPNDFLFLDSEGELSVNDALSDISLNACMRSVLGKSYKSPGCVTPIPGGLSGSCGGPSDMEGDRSPKKCNGNKIDNLVNRMSKPAKGKKKLVVVTDTQDTNPVLASIYKSVISKKDAVTPKHVKKVFRRNREVDSEDEEEEDSDSD